MRISGIYKIINKVNGKYYIGSTNHFHKRWNFGHKALLTENKHYNSKLQNSWNKHGPNNFTCTIIELVTPENLLIIEQKYLNIAKLEKEKCYNGSFIAGKVEMTPEVRRKLSIAHTGKKLSAATKKKMSNRMKGLKMSLGYKHTEEHKQRMSKMFRGRKISDEQKKQISNTLMGHPVSANTREKLKKSNKGHKPWNTGKIHSEKTRQKIAESLRNRNRLKKLELPAGESLSRMYHQAHHQDKMEKSQNKTIEQTDF